MSSPGEIAELVAVYSSYRANSAAAIASNAFFVYDFLVTFVDEVEFIWRRRQLSVTAALFLVLRYPTLWNIAVNIVKDDPRYFEVCDLLTKMSAIIVYSRYFPVAAFSGMRAYALCKSWALTALITVLSLAPMAVNFAQYGLGLHGVIDPISGCGYTVSSTKTDNIIFPIVSRGGLILADIILIAITWRTLGANYLGRTYHLERSRMTFANILLWNGTIYFISLFILNVLHLAFTLSLILGVLTTHASGIGQFTDPLSCVLVYRFILDLQEANGQELKLNSDDPLHFSVGSSGSVSFARIVGPVGSTIMPASGASTSESESESGSDSTSSEDLAVDDSSCGCVEKDPARQVHLQGYYDAAQTHTGHDRQPELGTGHCGGGSWAGSSSSSGYSEEV